MSILRKIDATIQDGTSPLYIVNFSNIVADTTITNSTVKDDNTIEVASAVGLVIGQYLTIYSVADNRVSFADILGIAGTTITLDTPLDFEFPIGSVVTVGTTNMAVDGSVTPQIFGIRNPLLVDISLSIDISRLMFASLTATEPQLSAFGDIANGLERGLVIRKVDGTYYNIVNFKTNMNMKNTMFDFNIQTVAKNAQDGFTGRFTVSALGAVIRLGPNEDLQIVVQDDLTSLTTFTVIAEGSEVVD